MINNDKCLNFLVWMNTDMVKENLTLQRKSVTHEEFVYALWKEVCQHTSLPNSPFPRLFLFRFFPIFLAFWTVSEGCGVDLARPRLTAFTFTAWSPHTDLAATAAYAYGLLSTPSQGPRPCHLTEDSSCFHCPPSFTCPTPSHSPFHSSLPSAPNCLQHRFLQDLFKYLLPLSVQV